MLEQGNDYLNRSMRLWVDKTGWTLSDHGLRRAVRSGVRSSQHSKVMIVKGPTLRCDTEKAVFAAIGVPYREPHERNCEPVEIAYPRGPVPRRPPPLAFSVLAAGGEDAEEEDAVLLEMQVRARCVPVLVAPRVTHFVVLIW